MPTTPTVAIGIGAAGARMQSALSEFVSEEGEEENFQFIAVDSNESDARGLSPDQAEPIPLRVPEDSDERAHHVEDYSYLPDGTIVGEQGSDRTRSVARYYVDNPETYIRIRNRLEREITSFWEARSGAVEDEQVHDLHIWLLHSFGGGTGSGSFPILAAILDQIVRSNDLNVTINAIGSLPRLDELEEDERAPDDTQFYANAYAGLYELRKIVEHDYATPLEITLEAERYDDDLVADALSLERNPFDMYWLIGYDEEQDSPSYRERMNEIAAVGIFYYANKTSLENFPDDQDYKDTVLYGISAAELYAPTDLAENFVHKGSEIDACEQILDALDNELTAHKTSRKYLEEVRETQQELTEIDIKLTHVREELVKTCHDRARSLQLYEILGEDADFDIDDVVNDLLNELEEDIRTPELVNPDGAIISPEELANRDQVSNDPSRLIRDQEAYDDDHTFDPHVIVEWFYCDQLEKHLQSELNTHQFNEVVEDVWATHAREGLEKKYGHLADAEPARKWTNGLESWLIEQWDKLEEQIEAITFNKIRERRLKSQQEQLDAEYAELEDLFDDYQMIDSVRQDAHARRRTARKVLDGDIRQLETLIDEKSDRHNTVRNKRERKVSRRNELRKTLSDFQEGETNRIGLKMNDLDSLTITDLDQAECITSLIESGYVSETDCAQALSTLLQGVGDPIHDDIRNYEANVDEIGGIMTHHHNVTPPEGSDVTGLLDLPLTGDRDIDEILMSLDYYDPEMIVEISQGFSLWFLKWFTPITFENTSEFGTIDEYFRSETADISDQLGGGISDEALAARFAYPEFFSEDDEFERERIVAPFD